MNDADIEKIKEQRKKIAKLQQNRASDPMSSVWVAASAGTGKTKVLTDRVLRLLLNGVTPSRILCLTYTKAAAVEMNSRIFEWLGRWAVQDEKLLRDELEALVPSMSLEKSGEYIKRARILFAEVLDTPGGLKIQTIHSFCQDILKRFPLEAGVSPYFKVLDDRTAKDILKKIGKELLLKAGGNMEPELSEAVVYLTKHVKEFKFSELLLTLIGQRNKISQILEFHHSFEAFEHALLQKFGLKKTDTKNTILDQYRLQTDFEMLKKMADALAQSTSKDQKKAQALYEITEKRNFSDCFEIYQSVFLTSKGLMQATMAYSKAVAVFAEIETVMRAEAERLLALKNKLLCLDLFEATSAFMRIASEIIKGYDFYKKQNSCLDYEDLIMLSRKLLENPDTAAWVLYKLDGGIDHVLIDEAQDTSPDQWAIIRCLTDEFFSGQGQTEQKRTVFAVGDRKQSIYSFQGADPAEFEKMRLYFSQKDPDFQDVRLDVSFRSTAAVLDMVNSVFKQPEAQSGVILENDSAEHVAFKLGEGGKVEIWPLVEAETIADEGWYPPIERKIKPSASALLAQKIALHIKQMVENRTILPSKNRPVQYRDMMILVQRRNAFVEELVRECKNNGVKITGVDKLKLLNQIAVEDLLSLARFLLLPSDDLSLAEVLKSPIFGFSEDDLFQLCYGRENMTLFQRLKADEAYAYAADTLSALLTKVDYVRPYELFNFVLTKLEGRQKIISRLGQEALDALDEFINLTLLFEQENLPTLQNFMRWIYADEVEIKRELEQAKDDAVRLMTVHGSKGLQAPIVFLPDTARVPAFSKKATLMFDDELAYYPLSAGAYDQTCSEIHQKQKEKGFEEYRRLLYVALTRAEDVLYVCGCKSSKDIDPNSWYKLCEKVIKSAGKEICKDVFAYEVPQLLKIPDIKRPITAEPEMKECAWLDQPAAWEEPLSKPYLPSHLEDENPDLSDSPLSENKTGLQKGLLMHKLLQFLPAAESLENIQNTVKIYLDKNAWDLPLSVRTEIRDNLFKILQKPELKFIFSENSKAEVPVVGEAFGKIYSAQIDRLVIENDCVKIIDFKTNRYVPADVSAVPANYVRQLKVYQALIEKIYTGKTVETYILWTQNAFLMKI